MNSILTMLKCIYLVSHKTVKFFKVLNFSANMRSVNRTLKRVEMTVKTNLMVFVNGACTFLEYMINKQNVEINWSRPQGNGTRNNFNFVSLAMK